MSQCPVVIAINEIYGGGIDDELPGIIIGGDDSQPVVYGDADFMISVLKLEQARFELSKPSLAKCIARLSTSNAGKTYREVYIGIIRASTSKAFLYKQIIELYSLIKMTEMALIEYIEHYGLRDGCAISLPTLALDGSVDVPMLYKPELLLQVYSAIVDYTNELNVNCLLKIPTTKVVTITTVELPTKIDMEKIIPSAYDDDNITTTSAIQRLREITAAEVAICEYIKKIEEYQSSIIVSLNVAYEKYRNIIAQLTADLQS